MDRPAAGNSSLGQYLCDRGIIRSVTADELLDALATLRRAIRRIADRPAELADLTGAQLELVRLLRRLPGLSIADAARELGVAPNTISTLVRQLADAGFVARGVDSADRRVARLELAPAMRQKVEAWRDRRVEVVESALAALPALDRRRLEAAVPTLLHLGAELEDELGAA
jgi:DNA-binding MarR family transcriptional regulator